MSSLHCITLNYWQCLALCDAENEGKREIARLPRCEMRRARPSPEARCSCHQAGLQGYLAHEKPTPPPMTATGAHAWSYCRVLQGGGFISEVPLHQSRGGPINPEAGPSIPGRAYLSRGGPTNPEAGLSHALPTLRALRTRFPDSDFRFPISDIRFQASDRRSHILGLSVLRGRTARGSKGRRFSHPPANTDQARLNTGEYSS